MTVCSELPSVQRQVQCVVGCHVHVWSNLLLFLTIHFHSYLTRLPTCLSQGPVLTFSNPFHSCRLLFFDSGLRTWLRLDVLSCLSRSCSLGGSPPGPLASHLSAFPGSILILKLKDFFFCHCSSQPSKNPF